MSIRITAGNDAPFRWAVKLQGKPFELSGKDVKVYVINSRGEIPVARLTIEGNEVSGVFEGRYQTRLGEHSLILRVNEGRPEMKTAAVANVFELVQWSTDAGGSDEGDVIVAPIVVESEITAGILAEYTKKDEFDSAVQTLSDQLEQKVNMEEGKGLSSNDFTNALKAKLESLSNYDDQELREAINAIESTIDTLIGDNASKKIESFNEIIRFLEGVEDTESLEGIVAGIQQSIAKKADASVVVSLAEEVQTLKTEVESQNELIEDLQNTKIDKEADDYYPQLAVGLADNLSGVDVVDSEVNFRRSGGGAISDGVARIEAIKGNSVVWNQVYPTDWNKTYDGITSTSTNGKITSTGTTSTTFFRFEPFADNVENHKYLFMLVGATSALDGKRFGLLNRGNTAYTRISNGMAYVFYTNTDSASQKNIGIQDLTTGAEINESLYINQIDLTKAFPNDWQNINTIEEFYARIPMGVDLNAYNEGEVIHMDVQSIESQGVNQWDEEWEVGQISSSTGNNVGGASIRSVNFIPVIGGEKYYFYCSQQLSNMYAQVFFYDSGYNFIKAAGLYSPTSTNAANFNNPYIAPSNARYIRFYVNANYGTIYNNDICINISDASINGKYFPYVKRTEDLSIIRKYFPDGMKLAGSAHDEIRYNKATQKWEYSKGRMKEVDMGTLTWGYIGVSDSNPYGRLSTALPSRMIGRGNLLCSVYSHKGASYKIDKNIFGASSDATIIVIDSSFTDAASFKAAMQGVILYYESNDWEWVELDAEDQFKDLDYQVWNCGTEKAIAEGKSAPLAADITYGFNAIGKIKELESLVAALRAKVGI